MIIRKALLPAEIFLKISRVATTPNNQIQSGNCDSIRFNQEPINYVFVHNTS